MKTFNPLQKLRLRRLNIRLTEEEWDKLQKIAGNTTCRSMSEYSRKILLNKPVKVFYRNQSFDDFEEQMTRLLPLMEGFGERVDQLVVKLLTLENVQEILEALQDLKLSKDQFLRIQEEVRANIEKLSDQCDPK